MLIKRRAFISASLAVAAGGSLQLLLSCKQERGTEETAVVELSRHFPDLESVRRVGQEALRMLPEDTTLETLIAAVIPQRPARELRREIEGQYLRGDTVELENWPIAVTEARIYALVALSNSEETR